MRIGETPTPNTAGQTSLLAVFFPPLPYPCREGADSLAVNSIDTYPSPILASVNGQRSGASCQKIFFSFLLPNHLRGELTFCSGTLPRFLGGQLFRLTRQILPPLLCLNRIGAQRKSKLLRLLFLKELPLSLASIDL